MDEISSILETYRIEYCLAKDDESYSYDDQRKMMDNTITIMEIIRNIDNKKTQQDVLKYIAPHLTPDKHNVKNHK